MRSRRIKAFVNRWTWRRLTALATSGVVIFGVFSSSTGAEPAVPGASPVVVPIQVSRGRILVPCQINDSSPLSFMLDTGFSLTMISPQHAETLQLKRSGAIMIAGIAGDERASVFGGATFNLCGATYTPERLAALPSDRRRQSRDGILGSGFFRRFVVEIDARAKSLKLHEPDTFTYARVGEILPLTFRQTTPVVQAVVRTPGGADVPGAFELDTGCDGLCLGREFVEAHQLVADGARSDIKRGVGGDARVRSGKLQQLRLGKLTFENPDADFFLEGSPVDAGLAGHIGMGILRAHRVIFDYSRRRMILESYPAGDTR